MFDLSSSIGLSTYAKSSDLIPLFFNEDVSRNGTKRGVFKKPSNYSDGYFFRSGRWTHSKLGAPPWLSYYGLESALEGYHFIFRGDSMMRQIFNRLVFHTPFNATQDLLAIDHDEVATAIRSSYQRTLGLHYWFPFPAGEKRLPRFNSSQTIFVTTPNLFGDEQIINKKAIHDRNEWIRINGSGNYIPLDAMTADGAFQMNREDSMHFQCSYLSRQDGWNGWMERVAVVNNEIQFKAPASGDCRDMVNLNGIMLLVNYVTTNATTTSTARAIKK
eukprot:gene24461-31852_t